MSGTEGDIRNGTRVGLGIDAGGSSTRWQLRDSAGNELGRGTAGSITGHVFTPNDLRVMRSRLATLLAEVLAVARPHAAVAGITGFHPASAASDELAAAISEELSLDRSRVSLVDDMQIAYASVFAPGEGILVYAGTGSVGYHVTSEGEPVRVGGYGFLIDDAGAGFWIGQQGIRQTMRWVDESPDEAKRQPLGRAVFGALGCEKWSDVAVTVYGGGRQRIASLAPAVAEAADQGDEAAAAILRRAGSELARLANLLLARLDGPLPVAFAGGIASLSRELTESLRSELPPGTEFEIARVEPIAAAVRLALQLAASGQVPDR